ncbi:Bacteriophage protein gp37 [Limihaloglobus sulfuriphilus]|uniref:Bacteriophage protein gp37 n=1 Tax=Limihaloglobus sulfuriphilus TaxID=1851148 RepID=A0A1Q2MHK8_9BACT|nr:phage Gp37/Gp68 family protein [Limihaloglobus sulfuriphilus]AQQ72144.1 Bacteriophage protein gp37 [Limihaloglobus sulfuriphilus]
MANTKIEWTESTWNPVTGCTKISAGCANCYAERMARRLQAMGQANYVNGFQVTLHPHVLENPLKWKKPQVIFVNSMSDLFHEDIPLDYIREVFNVMYHANWHTFQVLTKRSRRLAELAPLLNWPDNVWMGVTVENADCAYRIDDLRNVPSAVRFLSMEPLLSSVGNMNLDNINWVIVGGESGPGARPIEKEWVYDIKQQCTEAAVPFFFKQWGGVNKKKTGRKLNGQVYDEMPLITSSAFV